MVTVSDDALCDTGVEIV